MTSSETFTANGARLVRERYGRKPLALAALGTLTAAVASANGKRA